MEQKLRELTDTEILKVNGAETPPDNRSIMEILEDKFPGGEWVGNSFFPRGAPKPPPGPTTL